jgi:hypothetical protein
VQTWATVPGPAARRTSGLLLAAAGLLAVSPTHADAGTPLLLAGPVHLFVLNALIGAFEAWLLCLLVRRMVKLTYAPTAWAMIAANYTSAWLGAGLLLVVWPQEVIGKLDQPLYAASGVITNTWAFLFALSVVVEAPFVGAALRRGGWGLPWPGALGLSLVLQVASYVPLTAWYSAAAPRTLLELTSFDRSLAFARGVKATVYYAANADGSVWAVRPDGSGRRRLSAAGPTEPDELVRLQVDKGTGRLGLLAPGEQRNSWRVVARDLGPAPVFTDHVPQGEAVHPHRPVYLQRPGAHRPDFGRVDDLRPPDEQDSEIRFGFWPYEGITVRGPGYRAKRGGLQLALETPFLAVAPRFGTVLEGDVLIYEYAPFSFLRSPAPPRHQIVVLDLRSRTLGVLADGRCPVVVLDEPPRGAVPWRPNSEYGLRHSNRSVQGEAR